MTVTEVDRLARLMHDEFLAFYVPHPTPHRPAVPWDQLIDRVRDAYRHVARGVLRRYTRGEEPT